MRQSAKDSSWITQSPNTLTLTKREEYSLRSSLGKGINLSIIFASRSIENKLLNQFSITFAS